MHLIRSLIIAFSMYSSLPVPHVDWDEDAMRWSLCFFPLVGAVIGLFCLVWVQVCEWLSFPAVLRAAGLCLLPVLITGGIHLDGYADTSDALASHAGIERRQEILKDPHLGAFAAIRLCIYFTASFALWAALPHCSGAVLVCIFCLSRSLSAISLLLFPLRSGSGTARYFADAADPVPVRIVLFVYLLFLSVILLLNGAWPVLPAAALVFLRYRTVAVKDFGGLSGDLAGWFLQKAELWMLAALCIKQFMENRL